MRQKLSFTTVVCLHLWRATQHSHWDKTNLMCSTHQLSAPTDCYYRTNWTNLWHTYCQILTTRNDITNIILNYHSFESQIIHFHYILTKSSIFLNKSQTLNQVYVKQKQHFIIILGIKKSQSRRKFLIVFQYRGKEENANYIKSREGFNQRLSYNSLLNIQSKLVVWNQTKCYEIVEQNIDWINSSQIKTEPKINTFKPFVIKS